MSDISGQIKKTSFLNNKFVRGCIALITMAVLSTVIVSILNFFNIEQTDYLFYLLWCNALIVFFLLLPQRVMKKD